MEFTAPCPDDLATAPLPGEHAMGLHDITTPAADHCPVKQGTEGANPPAHDDPATQFEHDAPLT